MNASPDANSCSLPKKFARCTQTKAVAANIGHDFLRQTPRTLLDQTRHVEWPNSKKPQPVNVKILRLFDAQRFAPVPPGLLNGCLFAVFRALGTRKEHREQKKQTQAFSSGLGNMPRVRLTDCLTGTYCDRLKKTQVAAVGPQRELPEYGWEGRGSSLTVPMGCSPTIF